jgi:hypothetical protein
LIGDIIVEVNGKTVAKTEDLHTTISELNPGTKTEVKLYRNGAFQTLTVTLGVRPQRETPTPSIDLSEDKPKVTKAFGNFVVQLLSLKIVSGDRYILTMNLSNQSRSGPVWVALSRRQSLIDPSGNQLGPNDLSGISYGGTHPQYSYGGTTATVFEPTIQIQPGGSTAATITFASRMGSPAPGVCNVQLEFMTATGQVEGHARLEGTPNLTAKIEAK